MIYGSVCSGIEAASVAWHPLGWRAAFFAEIEPFPCAVLKHHYPDTPNLGDMTTIDGADWRGVDVLVGGTPCQSFSIAGLRGSLSDARGNLSLAFVRLAHAIPALRWAVWENVPGVLSTDDNAFGCFLAGLVGADAPLRSPLERGRWPYAGMVAGPRARAARRVLDAQHFGLAQRRERVFVVAGLGDGADPAAVLFEPKGVRRDTATSREARASVAGTLGGSSPGGGLGNRTSGGLSIESALNAKVGVGRMDFTTETFVVNARQTPLEYGDLSGPLDTNGATYAVVIHENQRGAVVGSAIRRLTPTECARLQGFPDDYLDIPYCGKPAADGPKYKALGNSMAVPVMRWIGRRIELSPYLITTSAGLTQTNRCCVDAGFIVPSGTKPDLLKKP